MNFCLKGISTKPVKCLENKPYMMKTGNKRIKKRISSESTHGIKFFPGTCGSALSQKIIGKYDISKKPCGIFPNLIFHKFKTTSIVVTNIEYLNAGDKYFTFHFNLVSYPVNRRKVEMIDRVFGNLTVPLFIKYIYRKHSNVFGSLSRSKEYGSSPCRISYRKKKKPDSGIITLQFPTQKLVSKLLYSKNEIKGENWEIKKLEVLNFRNSGSDRKISTSFHHTSLSRSSLEKPWISEDVRVKKSDTWNSHALYLKSEYLSRILKITISEILSFRYLEIYRQANTPFYHVYLPLKSFKYLLFPEDTHVNILDSYNSPVFPSGIGKFGKIFKTITSEMSNFRNSEFHRRAILSFQRISLSPSFLENSGTSEDISMNLPDTWYYHDLSLKRRDSNEILGIVIGNILNRKYCGFLGTVRLNNQKADFPIGKLLRRQKTSKLAMHTYEDTDLEKNVWYKSSFLENNTVLEHTGFSHEIKTVGQTVVKDLGNPAAGNKQDIILRRPVIYASTEDSDVFEKYGSESISKNATHIPSKKEKSFVVSSGEMNTIADKVYKLLEAKLLIEKERRGLR